MVTRSITPQARKIKALMMLAGVTNLGIARQSGVSKTWVSLVLHGHKQSARIRLAIARALGVSVEELWPEYRRAA